MIQPAKCPKCGGNDWEQKMGGWLCSNEACNHFLSFFLWCEAMKDAARDKGLKV